MCTFYYPDRSVIEESNLKKSEEKFIEFYSKAYYNDCGFKIKGISRNVGQNSRYVEKVIDELLQKTEPYDERDLVRILSWKIGKIRQKESEKDFLTSEGGEKLERELKAVSDSVDLYPYRLSEKYENTYQEYISVYEKAFQNMNKNNNHIVYAKKWLPSKWEVKKEESHFNLSDFQFIGAFGRKLGVDELIKVVAENKELTQMAREGSPQDVLNLLLVKDKDDRDAIKGIGTVYLLTVLYFLSGGRWPIYDRFADKALQAIIENNSPKEHSCADNLPQKSDYINRGKDDMFGKDVEKHIENYKVKIEKAFGDYKKYEGNRDIDRALWVYGHLFA